MSSIEYINSVVVLDAITTNITFSNIPQNYNDLIIRFQGGQTANSGVYIRLNSDTGTNYSRTTLFGNGATVSSTRASNLSTTQWVMGANIPLNNSLQDSGEINILNYSNPNIFKTMLQNEGDASTGVSVSVLLWRSTNSITQIELINAGSDKFTSGSSFILWGVK